MSNNLDDAPSYQSIDKICYNCTECSSLIEIIEINKDLIKFKCINNEHENEMELRDYLDKMKKYNNREKNNDICVKHNNKYISYCFDCKNHLCNECLKNRTHINHQKNNIIEMKPTEDELDIIKQMIKENQIKIENIKKEKEKVYKYLKEKLSINKDKILELNKKRKNIFKMKKKKK